MKRFAVALVSVLTAVLAVLWLTTREPPRSAHETVPTHLGPDGVPDFAAYPAVDTAQFVLREGEGFPVQGFRTPGGFVCLTTQHRAMYALDCRGPFVGAPDGANLAHLFSYGTTNGAIPMSFSYTDQPLSPVDGLTEDEAPMLPAGQRFDVGNATCIYTDDILLACRMADPEKGNGFIATTTETTSFGRS
ncbi:MULTISPECIES: hypothetical protein [unclassified Mycolicibacterium]|uniref:hypothetical protein n=1 Tax=unclassified Mycolicibacterium TaxID=2636767 RepID=UPI0012DFD5D5|nr:MULTISPECIES: hypothetical protein [unclassified Mycolicibacterium]MUL85268.1 hypothetical protein [Mycolicibacterium sp. CBMA 329]MUL91235.1 hypothetical protein [Mycolicibacterium sp. CBMA 331]MUL98096.1 hypothetical protein [Mycolicibacterium sp. CBMA 334]MUM27773.1 hypothetical protein [Mycolicibacterium sp. CBMA 295]MUM40994.1 hypothetical protein [Mycolicibacterium sp. CBMA 247]